MTGTTADWRTVDGVATAWFDAPSLTEGAALTGRLLDLTGDVLVDLRATGVRVRVGSDEHAGAVSAVARDLGLTADPSALQRLSVVVESPDPAAVRPFWQGVLGYAPTDDGGLVDPLRRDPALRVRRSGEPRPLRNRLHLDVVRPGA
ncbi:VOC family protein, partial [Cellulomonas septica]